jgi:hypothetical protein
MMIWSLSCNVYVQCVVVLFFVWTKLLKLYVKDLKLSVENALCVNNLL